VLGFLREVPYMKSSKFSKWTKVACGATATMIAAAVPVLAQARGTIPAAATASAPTGSTPTFTGAARWADSVRRLIEPAQLRGDERALREAIALAERALAVTPNEPTLLHYKGYALYRLGALLIGPRNGEAKETLEEADRALEASAARLPWPETFALRSAVLGQIIGASGGGAILSMRLGMRSSSLMDRAVELGPENPRVWALRSSGELFKPELVGGGAENATKSAQRAVALLARDRPDGLRPAWGAIDAYLWLGQAHASAGRTAEARAAYQQVLTLAPDHGWVKRQLLPALDRTK